MTRTYAIHWEAWHQGITKVTWKSPSDTTTSWNNPSLWNHIYLSLQHQCYNSQVLGGECAMHQQYHLPVVLVFVQIHRKLHLNPEFFAPGIGSFLVALPSQSSQMLIFYTIIFAHMYAWIYKEHNALASRIPLCLSTIYTFISRFIFV